MFIGIMPINSLASGLMKTECSTPVNPMTKARGMPNINKTKNTVTSAAMA